MNLPRVVSVSADAEHRFSKPVRESITLIEGVGIAGDAHAGATVQHRYLAKKDAALPNLRQVHLIQRELFDEIADSFTVGPGELGENVALEGLDLLALPVGATLRLGDDAVVTLTGLRVPCGLIDRFQKGLKRQLIVRAQDGVRLRAGVMGVVSASGLVKAGDAVAVGLPPKPWAALPALP